MRGKLTFVVLMCSYVSFDQLPCFSDSCTNNATCSNGKPTYNCSCLPRYSGSNCEKKESLVINCKRSNIGYEYRGVENVTISGYTCQRWDSQLPHKHGFTQLKENYCRNPDKEPAPWCYTTNPKVRWEICNIPKCGTPASECSASLKGEDYFGKTNKTKYGETCQRWDSQYPHSHKHGYLSDQENYCRNPYNSKRGPWCYTTNSKSRWNLCAVPACRIVNCKRSNIGYEYRGVENVTISGYTCQRWDSQWPHKHKFTQLKENYCRNPDKEPAPWCYTTNPNVRWEICNISKCDTPASECFTHPKGVDYFGKTSRTKYGEICQRWDSQSPHSHGYGYLYDQDNYCRNPYGHEKGPWCYTINPKTRWNLCEISECRSGK